MPSVPISVSNANQPGGPVILGADGKIPSSAMPASIGGGGGGAHIVNCVIAEAAIEPGSTEYMTVTEKTAGEIFELACNGSVIINGAISVSSDGNSWVDVDFSAPVLFCAKGLLDPENYPNDDLVDLALYSAYDNMVMNSFYQANEPVIIGYPPRSFNSDPDEPSISY